MTRRKPQTGVTIPEIVISVALLIGVFVIFSTRSQEYMNKAKKTGTQVTLEQIKRRLKSYYVETARFPDGNAKHPAKPCCSYPDQRCPIGGMPDPVWQSLDVDLDDPRFQFEYRGTANEVTVIATGDPDCDGDLQKFTLRATAESGNPLITISED